MLAENLTLGHGVAMSKLDFFTWQNASPDQRGQPRSLWRLNSRDACDFVVGILISYTTLGWQAVRHHLPLTLIRCCCAIYVDSDGKTAR